MARGGKRTDAGRKKRMDKKQGLSITLSPIAHQALESLTQEQGISKSEAIERLVIRASLPDNGQDCVKAVAGNL